MNNISKATIKNWEKLNPDKDKKLTKRANKKESKRRILPIEYIKHKDNLSFILSILEYIDKKQINIFDAIFSLGQNLLVHKKIENKKNVLEILNKYKENITDEYLLTVRVPDNEYDILGAIYQSYLYEGIKNSIGSYYTPYIVCANMTKNIIVSANTLFLDPCCGSGSFLLSVNADNPNQLYGIDNDNIAVFITKVNLLLKYSEFNFIPHIYTQDFLVKENLKQEFDYIITNPPWGAINNKSTSITSKETFSRFFIKSYSLLKNNGIIRFLFPEAILNVKTHKDIRKFILDNLSIESIMLYENLFNGVTTKFIDIECQKKAKK